MKNLIYFPIRVLLITIILYGSACTHKEEEPQPVTVPAAEVSVEILSDFLSSSMRIEKNLITYNTEEQYFVIDGDMVIAKKEAEAHYRQEKGARTDQWRDPYLVSAIYSHNIKLYINPVVPADWQTAVRAAIANWNAVTGIRVNISEVYSAASADISVSTGYDAVNNWVARASLPLSNGKPGNWIAINTYYNGLAANVKTFTITHEMGHNFGLWHTNQNYGIYIPGTPPTDANSVMNSWVLPWVGFTAGDLTAARIMYPGAAWQTLNGSARDIGVGKNGTAWMIGPSVYYGNANGDGNIFRWNGSGWVNIPGEATRIDVDPAGNAWVVQAAGWIYRYNGSSWVLMPGRARDIGIGANGTVWAIGWNADPGSNEYIYRWNGSGWVNIPGIARRIDVDPAGNAWVVQAAGDIYRYNGSGWVWVPGKAKDVGIGTNDYGTVYVIGTDYNGFQWNGSGWVPLPAGAYNVNITADPQGLPWTTSYFKGIHRFD